MKKMEEEDEPPSDLSEWPDDEAKYITYGGGEGDHGYDEGPEKKLGPSSLERHEDGSVTIDGEEVDNPDEYKARREGQARHRDDRRTIARRTRTATTARRRRRGRRVGPRTSRATDDD